QDPIKAKRVGILAYGSLMDDPREEIRAVTVDITRDVFTPFAVEFARSSRSRAGAPTLVPVTSGGAKIRGLIYQVGVDERSASDVLYRRETNQVGSGRTYREPAPHKRDAVRIKRHPNFAGYDIVLSTSLQANIQALTAEHLADLAIDSVANAET